MDKNLQRYGYGLLVPASLIFGVKALLLLFGMDGVIPGFAFAIAGILSGIGMVLLIFGFVGTPYLVQIVSSVIIAFTGHWIVSRVYSENLGGAMVYLGTAFAASVRTPWAAAMGVIAGLGAILRNQPSLGAFPYAMIAIGALGTAIALLKNAEK